MALPIIIGIAAAAAIAVGAKKAVDGYQSHSRAGDLLYATRLKYTRKKEELDSQDEGAQLALQNLGKLELEIGQSFETFSKLANEILSKFNQGRQQKLSVNLPAHQLQKIEAYQFTALGVLGSIAGAGVAGAAAGFAVYGGVMSFAAASTGTLISSLSGVAAYNATLAAIGGGALSVGGLGMAGGMAILGAAITAPILAISAWAYANHGEEALRNAQSSKDEVFKAVEKMDRAIASLKRVEEYADKVYEALSSLYVVFQSQIKALQEVSDFIIAAEKNSVDPDSIKQMFDSINQSTLLQINNGYMLASILTEVITTPLFKFKEENNGIVKDENGVPVIATDSDGSMILNDLALDAAIAKSAASAHDTIF